MKFLIFATAGISLAIGQARACDGLNAASNPTCAEWAPLSGDVSEDACVIAKLSLARLQDEFDPTRPRTVADDPLPARAEILGRLQAAQSRINDECK